MSAISLPRLALAFSLVLILAAPVSAAAPATDILAGNQAAEAGNLDQAIKLFSKAIDSKKLSKENLAIAYNNRGSAYDDKGNIEQAVRDYTKAIEINPEYDAAYYNRSFAQERKGRLPQALADMEKAARLVPDDPDFQQRLEYLRAKKQGAQ
jgi:tetratricopeptide (TPR) repeat protein